MKFDELIAASVNAFANEYRRTGTVLPGTNGPRAQAMTPVRNAGHWLYAVCVVNRWQPTHALAEVAERLRDYLLAPEQRPFGFTHRFRDAPGFDRCGGVIGPAWAIEALVEAAESMADERCIALAEEIFFMHGFDERMGLWRRREIAGAELRPDRTWDHQLWFAGCAGGIRHRRRSEIEARIARFLDCLPENMEQAPNGRIGLAIRDRRPLPRRWASRAKAAVSRALARRTNVEAGYPAEVVDSGYQGFSAYALAMLARQFPGHPTLRGPAVRAAMDYLRSDRYRDLLEGNIFGYDYNPPGFEVPFALSVLAGLGEDKLLRQSAYWVNEQVKRTFDFSTMFFGRGTADPVTVAARLYEATRIPRSILSRIEIERPAEARDR